MGCVTNVDSYSLYACTYVTSARDISTIVCYRQVLFVAVTTLLRFLEEEKQYFCCVRFSQNSTYNLLRMCAYNYTLLENYPYIPCVPSLSTSGISQLAPFVILSHVPNTRVSAITEVDVASFNLTFKCSACALGVQQAAQLENSHGSMA